MSDHQDQRSQLQAHAAAIRVYLESAEAAGASIPAIHDAKELFEAAMLKAMDAMAAIGETL